MWGGKIMIILAIELLIIIILLLTIILLIITTISYLSYLCSETVSLDMRAVSKVSSPVTILVILTMTEFFPDSPRKSASE